MALNPGGNSNYSWHYSAKHEDRTLELVGTIVSLQEIQAREFSMGGQPGRPAFWHDGKPKMNIRVGLATPEGQLKSITFSKAGKKQISGEKPSLHMQLFNVSGGNMSNLIGKTIHIWTWDADPETGMNWGQGNPRKFGLELVPDVAYELTMQLPDEFKVPALYANDGVAGGQPVAPAPQQMQQPPMPPMQGQYFAPPMVQQQPRPMQQPYPYNMQQPAQYQPQPMQPQPMQQMPQMQPQMQPQMPQQPMPAVQAMPPQQAMTAPMPQGMDPAVMAAMQAAGATNVQMVAGEGGSVYDDGIPF